MEHGILIRLARLQTYAVGIGAILVLAMTGTLIVELASVNASHGDWWPTVLSIILAGGCGAAVYATWRGMWWILSSINQA
jgi:hypothetical protein